MANTLVLSFFSAPSPQLDRVEFRPQSGPVCACARGVSVGSHAGAPAGTFHWTKAVRALCVLALKTHLHRNDPTVVPSLVGTKGSLAVALDYALSKEPQWLVDMFGADRHGRATARRLLKRGNPEGKRPGPVTVAFGSLILRDTEIRITVDNQVLAGDGIAELLGALKDTDEIIAKAPPRSGKKLAQHTRVVPLASPLIDDFMLLPISIPDLLLDVVHTEGAIPVKALAQKVRDLCRPAVPNQLIQNALRNLTDRGIFVLNNDVVQPHETHEDGRASFFQNICELAKDLGFLAIRTSNRSVKFDFSSLAEMDVFLGPLYDICLRHTDARTKTWWHLNHSTWPLVRPQAECRRSSDFPYFRNTAYLCRGSGPIDAWVSRFYKKMGVVGHLNSKSPYPSDFWLMGDLYIEHQIPAALQKAMSEFIHSFSSIDNFDNIALEKAFYAVSERCEVEVHFAPGLAENTRAKLSCMTTSRLVSPV